MKISSSRFLPAFLVSLFCFGFYSGLFLFGEIRTESNKFNYHKHLSLSLLAGRLDIPCPAETRCHDLAIKDGKYFFYQPPVPSMFLIPAVLIWGENTPDSLIIAVLGAANVFLLSLLLLRIKESFPNQPPHPSISAADQITPGDRWDFYLLPILWGLGTGHFYMSMQGDVWHISQIMAQLFLIAAAYLILGKGKLPLISSGLFFALACYTRYDLIFLIFMFLFVLRNQMSSRREFFRSAIIFATPFLLISVLMLFYNYARFGNMLELGIKYMILEVQSGVAARVAEVGKASVANIPHNFYQEFLRPPEFSTLFPFLKMNPHGFGLLWATPYFILVFPIIGSLYLRYLREELLSHRDRFALGALVSLLILMVFLLLLSGHGFMQFGARYTLDLQLCLVILLTLYPSYGKFRTKIGLLALSIYINCAGAILFTNFFHRVAGVP
jgi:hypothetical protein